MGMFDSFYPNREIKCPHCDKVLSDEWQSKDLTSDMMNIDFGKKTTFNGMMGREISLQKFHKWDDVDPIECYAFCFDCTDGKTTQVYAHVDFAEDGTFDTFELNRAYNDQYGTTIRYYYDLKKSEWKLDIEQEYDFNRETKVWEIDDEL